MVQVTDAVRSASPQLAAWAAANLRIVTGESTVWQALRMATGMTEARARDAVSGGFSSPVLALGDLGDRDSAFDPAQPDKIWLNSRLAKAFEAMPANRQAQALVTAALLAQIVSWSALRSGRNGDRQAVTAFLTAAYPTPPDRTWLPAAQDDGRFTIALEASDIDDLVRITAAEAGSEPRRGQAGVVFVVLNRVASTRFPNSVRAVLDANKQFEPVMNTPSKSVVGLPLPGPALVSTVQTIVEEIASGTMEDPTKGATFFQNTAITSERGTEFAVGVTSIEIGHHNFYDRFTANDPVKVAPWRLTTPLSRAAAAAAPSAPQAGVVI